MSSDVFFKCDDLCSEKQVVYIASELTISPFSLPQSLSLSSLAIKPRPLIADCQFWLILFTNLAASFV